MDYIQSIACTKYVSKNGKATQHHSGMNINNATVKAKDKMKYIQYFPVDFEVVDMSRIMLLIFNDAKVRYLIISL